MVEYDIKLGIKSTKHGTGSKDSKSKTIQLRPNDYIRKIDGRTCNFYGQIMLTSIYVSTEQGMRFGPFGEFEDPDREFEVKVKKFSEKNDFSTFDQTKSFTVGGQYCRLEYLSGKCERNEREEWITQLGFHWEYWFEEEFHSCGMSSPSLTSAGYPSRSGWPY